MSKITVDYTSHFTAVLKRMHEDGLLMVTANADGKPNVMTIGWGAVGAIWGLPVFVAFVRPSRYTYSRLEEVDEFTINVPDKKLTKAVLQCGTTSGRDSDKFEEIGLTPVAAKTVKVPVIQECVMHYECRVIHRNDVVPSALDKEIISSAYSQGDFHRIYYGRILAVYADEIAIKNL